MKTFKSMKSLFCLALMLAMVFLFSSVATAGPYGTTAGETIANAKSADTLPLAAGELSVAVQTSDGSDTNYADTSTVVSTQVDTGFDMTPPADVSSTLVDGAVSSGDSRVVKYLLANRGNNAQPVPFDLSHLPNSDSGVAPPNVKNDSFTLELFHMDGDVAFDTTTATRVSGSDGVVNFAEGDTKSIFLVVTPRNNALPGDTVQSDVFLTDNAPIDNGDAATVGDQWQDGVPITGEDTNDTQFHNFTTTLQGSNIKVHKSLNLVSGNARPGDTIEYTITAWNDGNTASDTTLVADALPDSTVYVGGSDSTKLGGNSLNTTRDDVTSSGSLVSFSFNFDFSNDSTGASNDSTDGVPVGELDPNIKGVFLALEGIGASVGGNGYNPGDSDTVQFSYRVVIE